MIEVDGGIVRLRVSFLRRWRPLIIPLLSGVGCLALGVALGVHLITKPTSVTTLGLLVFSIGAVVFGAGGITLTVRLVRYGRRASAGTPVLEATADTIQLHRPTQSSLQITRAKVASATFEFQVPTGARIFPTARLEWFDTRHRSLGEWNLNPMMGRSMRQWMDAAGIDGTVTNLGTQPIWRRRPSSR